MKNQIKKVYRNWSRDSKARGNRKITATAPDNRQQELYLYCLKKALKKKKHPPVLVLGATPEVRNLALSLGCNTLAADINYDMIFNLEPNIKNSEDFKNMVMRANWLDLDQFLKNHSFDVVIGDGVIGQLDPVGIKKLVEVVNKLLKPGGSFITRIDVYNPEYPVGKFSKLLNQFRKGEIDFLNFSIKLLLYSDFSYKFYDKKKKVAYTYKLWDFFEEMYKKGIITKKENDYMQKRRVNLTHYFLSKLELYGKILGKYFREIPIRQFDLAWPTYWGVTKK